MTDAEIRQRIIDDMQDPEKRRITQDFRREWEEYRLAAAAAADRGNRKLEACETNVANTGKANIERHP